MALKIIICSWQLPSEEERNSPVYNKENQKSYKTPSYSNVYNNFYQHLLDLSDGELTLMTNHFSHNLAIKCASCLVPERKFHCQVNKSGKSFTGNGWRWKYPKQKDWWHFWFRVRMKHFSPEKKKRWLSEWLQWRWPFIAFIIHFRIFCYKNFAVYCCDFKTLSVVCYRY